MSSGREEEAGYATETAGMLIGEYEVTRRLGEGGMGTVYAVVHPVIGKRAAVKVITAELSRDEGAIRRFVREARAVNEIGHPNVVDVFGFGELPDGRHYFVMELLEGSSLADRLERGSVPVREALAILDQIAATVEVVHGKGIIHRDLKPDNVFLVGDREPKIKLLDFGIAKLAAKEAAQPELTSTGDILGTPLYMAPEQVQGGAVTPQADVYALGVLAYEMLLGDVPFTAATPVEAAAKHLYEPPPDPRARWPGMHPALAEVILGMLDKQPQRRPRLVAVRQVLADVREDLARYVYTGQGGHDETVVAGGEAEPPGGLGYAETVERAPGEVANSLLYGETSEWASAAGASSATGHAASGSEAPPLPAPDPRYAPHPATELVRPAPRRAARVAVIVLGGLVAVAIALIVGWPRPRAGEQAGAAAGADAAASGAGGGDEARPVIVEPLAERGPPDAGARVEADASAAASARPPRRGRASEPDGAERSRRRSRRRAGAKTAPPKPEREPDPEPADDLDDPDGLVDPFH